MPSLIKLLAITIFSFVLTSCAGSLTTRLKQTPSYTRYKPSSGSDMGSAMLQLAEFLATHNYNINIVSHEEMAARNGGRPAFGMNYYMVREIFINGSLPINTQFETLCHEAGHIFESAALNQEMSEMFAEYVGNGIQKHYGSKTADNTSSAYLAPRRHLLVFYPLMKDDIDRAIRMLTGKSAWRIDLEQASELGHTISQD